MANWDVPNKAQNVEPFSWKPLQVTCTVVEVSIKCTEEKTIVERTFFYLILELIIFPIFSGLAHVFLLLMSSKLLEDREVIVLDIPLHHTSV